MAATRVFFFCAMVMCASANNHGTCQQELTLDTIPGSSKVSSDNAGTTPKHEPTDRLSAGTTPKHEPTDRLSASLDRDSVDNTKIKNNFADSSSQNCDFESGVDSNNEYKVKEILAKYRDYSQERKKVNPIDVDSVVHSAFGDNEEHAKDDTKQHPESSVTNGADDIMMKVETLAKHIHGEHVQVESIRAHLEDKSEIEGNQDDEFPPSVRRNPGNVGDITLLELPNGETREMVTLSKKPPIFSIDNFLSDEECDYIIEKSLARGMEQAGTFQDKRTMEQGKNFGNARISDYCRLSEEDLGRHFTKSLHEKIARLIDMPVWVVASSETLDVKRYHAGGHYHAHLDSNVAPIHQPCCFQQECLNDDGEDQMNADCCKCCRHATALYYLNDVDEGGETAFPLADLSYTQLNQRTKSANWHNLSSHCHEAEVVVKPQKGKAVFWYNTFLDKHGYLGGADYRSFHGGCDVKQGRKWIATNWIVAPNYSKRFQRSKFIERYTYLKE